MGYEVHIVNEKLSTNEAKCRFLAVHGHLFELVNIKAVSPWISGKMFYYFLLLNESLIAVLFTIGAVSKDTIA